MPGCASGPLRQGLREYSHGRYDAAIQLFQEAVENSPQDNRAHRELGIAYFRVGRVDESQAALSRAQVLDPRDARTLLYLGLILERTGQLDSAIRFYARFADLHGTGNDKKLLAARIRHLTTQKLRLEIREAIAGEDQADAQSLSERTVAVIPFVPGGGTPDDEVRLGRALAVMLMTDLKQVSALTVVERTHLNVLLDEMKMGGTSQSDEQAALFRPRIGKLLGAGTVITGIVLNMAEGKIRVDALSAPSQGDGAPGEPIVHTDRLQAFLDIEKELAVNLLDQMGVTYTPEELYAIRQFRPTENLDALLAWCDGLYYQDLGDPIRAQDAFRHAMEVDPALDEARDGAGDSEDDHAALEDDAISQIGDSPDIIGGSDFIAPDGPMETVLDQVGGSFVPAEPEQTEPRLPTIGEPPPPPPPPPRD